MAALNINQLKSTAGSLNEYLSRKAADLGVKFTLKIEQAMYHPLSMYEEQAMSVSVIEPPDTGDVAGPKLKIKMFWNEIAKVLKFIHDEHHVKSRLLSRDGTNNGSFHFEASFLTAAQLLTEYEMLAAKSEASGSLVFAPSVLISLIATEAAFANRPPDKKTPSSFI